MSTKMCLFQQKSQIVSAQKRVLISISITNTYGIISRKSSCKVGQDSGGCIDRGEEGRGLKRKIQWDAHKLVKFNGGRCRSTVNLLSN